MPAAIINDVKDDVGFESCGEGCFILSGALTFATVPHVYAQGNAVFAESGGSLTLDLQGIKHTDSAGLALLLEWMRTAQHQDQHIHFKNIPAQMLSIARLSGLDTVLPLS
ncbi:MAG: STAS domain-containing protein [Gammaproteobacteria bacterium]